MELANFDPTSMPLDMPSNPSEFSKSERQTALLVVLLSVAEYSSIAFWNNPFYIMFMFSFRNKRRMIM